MFGVDFDGIIQHLVQDPLLAAVASGDPARVRAGLDSGADPTADNSCALRWAAQHGKAQIVRILLQDGRADPAADESEALRYAANNGHTETVRALLRDGRSHADDVNGEAYVCAAENGHTEVVCLLFAALRSIARVPRACQLTNRRRFPQSVGQFLHACKTSPFMARMLEFVHILLKSDIPTQTVFAIASEGARRNIPPDMVLQLHARGVLQDAVRNVLGETSEMPSVARIEQQRDLTTLARVSKAEPRLQAGGAHMDLAQLPGMFGYLAPLLPSPVAIAIWYAVRAEVRGEAAPRMHGTPAERVRHRIAAKVLQSAGKRLGLEV